MNPVFSLWLDALRAGAALTVLFGHMAHVRFTGGDYYFLREWNVASDAVAVFFVLSGFVIAYAAGRDGTLSRFAFNRITRIASVLIPALILTLVFDAIGTRIDMTAYPEGYYQAVPIAEFLWRGLTATNYWTGVGEPLRLGSNGPVWSLSYEVGFYIIFGCVVFLKGALRLAMLCLMALLVGIPVLALLPAWWVGVLAWKAASRTTVQPPRMRSWAMAVGSIAMLLLFKLAGVPQLLEMITARALEPRDHHWVLLYSNEVLWNSVIAGAIAVHLVGVKRLVEGAALSPHCRICAAVRWLAGGSFSLYLVHYPTLQLLDATLPETLPAYDLWLLVITMCICFGFAAVFERPIKGYRTAILAMGQRVRPLTMSRSKSTS